MIGSLGRVRFVTDTKSRNIRRLRSRSNFHRTSLRNAKRIKRYRLMRVIDWRVESPLPLFLLFRLNNEFKRLNRDVSFDRRPETRRNRWIRDIYICIYVYRFHRGFRSIVTRRICSVKNRCIQRRNNTISLDDTRQRRFPPRLYHGTGCCSAVAKSIRELAKRFARYYPPRQPRLANPLAFNDPDTLRSPYRRAPPIQHCNYDLFLSLPPPIYPPPPF